MTRRFLFVNHAQVPVYLNHCRVFLIFSCRRRCRLGWFLRAAAIWATHLTRSQFGAGFHGVTMAIWPPVNRTAGVRSQTRHRANTALIGTGCCGCGCSVCRHSTTAVAETLSALKARTWSWASGQRRRILSSKCDARMCIGVLNEDEQNAWVQQYKLGVPCHVGCVYRVDVLSPRSRQLQIW